MNDWSFEERKEWVLFLADGNISVRKGELEKLERQIKIMKELSEKLEKKDKMKVEMEEQCIGLEKWAERFKEQLRLMDEERMLIQAMKEEDKTKKKI